MQNKAHKPRLCLIAIIAMVTTAISALHAQSGKYFTEVSTLAGKALSPGSTNGPFLGLFRFPQGVSVDNNDNIFVADADNNMIRMITLTGTVSTFAGGTISGSVNGAGTAAKFNGPRSLAFAPNGKLYVADANNNMIREISAGGVVTTLCGTTTSGSANGNIKTARFNRPSGIAVDAAGNIYVADAGNNMIRKITPAGVVTSLAGDGSQGSADGTGTSARFNSPTGLTTDASGNVYVADNNNNRIRKITPAGVVSTLAGSTSGSDNGSGAVAKFNHPAGIAVDHSGNLYIADDNNNKIRIISPNGTVSTYAGSGAFGSANGANASASFNSPRGVAVSKTGNIVYVADCSNHLIRKIKLDPIQH